MIQSEKKCTKCGEMLSIDKFSPTKRNQDGSVKYRNSQCVECRASLKRKTPKYKDSGVSKECRDCRVIKPYSEFSPAVRGKFGLSAYCKLCHAERYRDKEKSRTNTARYRATHPERWKAAHRIHQFNRRSLIKATDDGTVTDDFLKMIYSTEKCYWCGKFTPKHLRTLEHVVELSNGGSHSASNITMACVSCNSSRLNKENIENANQCKNHST